MRPRSRARRTGLAVLWLLVGLATAHATAPHHHTLSAGGADCAACLLTAAPSHAAVPHATPPTQPVETIVVAADQTERPPLALRVTLLPARAPPHL